MTTSTAAIADFLLARIGEDEATARAATSGPWTHDGGIYADHPTNEIVDYVYEQSDAAHIARHDPARVLAECAAKRAIVELFETSDDIVIYPAVAALAAVYADHADYRSEWAS